MSRSLSELLEAVRAFCQEHYPGLEPEAVTITFRHGRAFRTPLPPAPRPAHAPTQSAPEPAPAWEPTEFQSRLLEALEFRALHTDDLAQALGIDRRNVFRKPRGIGELREQGLVALHPRLGYFRPDAPPKELSPDG
jgi:hypothetical protein